MSTYIVGDVHGCFDELQLLLKQVNFDPSHDTLWLTGDLVARGPNSLEVVRYIKSLGPAARIVLGNHDLHLLAVHAGITRRKSKDHLKPLLKASDAEELIKWLRTQPLLQVDEEKKLIMAHAGITPQWDIATARHCASEVEKVLASNSYCLFLDAMYENMPDNWSGELKGLSRLRFCTNVLTRMRYCFPNGQLDMICKEPLALAPPPLVPWFEVPGKIPPDYTIIFGHWAALGGINRMNRIIGLDTGCCYGGSLTLLRWEDKTFFKQPALTGKKDKK